MAFDLLRNSEMLLKFYKTDFFCLRQRIPKKYIYYYKSPDHNGHNVLSICHGFDKEEDIYQFAFSFPFSYSKCQAHLKQMEQKQFPFFKREVLAQSIVSFNERKC